jgi:hypothetical protein
MIPMIVLLCLLLVVYGVILVSTGQLRRDVRAMRDER